MSTRFRRAAVYLLVVCATAGAATTASAQGLGVRTGAHFNPDQFSVGAQYDFATTMDRLWLQPSADLGFGNDAFLTALNFDAVYRRPVARGTIWTAFAGAGPAINHYRFSGFSQTDVGANVLGGLMHRSGLFTELRIGFFDSPQVGFRAGYRFNPRPAARTPVRRPPARTPTRR
jgi:hypothetical protein